MKKILSAIIPSQQHVYVWQYVLGIGEQVVLYTKHVEKNETDSEPKNATASDAVDECYAQMLNCSSRTYEIYAPKVQS